MRKISECSTHDFFAWVMYQPEDRPICHRGWTTCAFGDWIKECRIEAELDENGEANPDPENLSDLDDYMECLVFRRISSTNNEYYTMGALQKLICRQYPQYLNPHPVKGEEVETTV